MSHIITMPVCEFCGSDEAWPCQICDRITCRDCVKLVDELDKETGDWIETCLHIPYKEVANHWKTR